MGNVSMNTELNASAEEVWKVISDFNGLTKFISAIVDSTTEGTGVGAVRTLTLENGAQIVERLESLDGQARKLGYSILTSPLPLEGYVAVMTVLALDDDRCKLVWSSTFQPHGAPESEVKNILEGIYSMGFEGLQKFFGSS
jgi:mxaD protein